MRIKALREAKGMTQQALADAVGVDRSAVSLWETGDKFPLVAKLPKIARALGVEWYELFDSDFGKEVAQ